MRREDDVARGERPTEDVLAGVVPERRQSGVLPGEADRHDARGRRGLAGLEAGPPLWATPRPRLPTPDLQRFRGGGRVAGPRRPAVSRARGTAHLSGMEEPRPRPARAFARPL